MSLQVTTALARALSLYFSLFERVLPAVLGFGAIELRLAQPGANIDQRLAKIEDARRNLSEALDAIDDLTKEAERNKHELHATLNRLEQTKIEHEGKAKELDEIKKIADADIQTFRKLAGVPDPLIERAFGFVAGVFASLIAAGLWALGSYLLGGA